MLFSLVLSMILGSGNYNIITAKTFCVWDREKAHE